MKRLFILALLALPLLVTSCAYNLQYRPMTPPEKIENRKALLDVYPNDVRTNLDLYTNTIVAWAGIIRESEADDGEGDTIHVVTTFEHHYFDWEEDRNVVWPKYLVSPKSEGTFRAEWYLKKRDPDAKLEDADRFTEPGKLAIVYGIPEKVEDNVVVLKYRYLRMIGKSYYTTNEFEYGRFGEPFRYLGKKSVSTAPAAAN